MSRILIIDENSDLCAKNISFYISFTKRQLGQRLVSQTLCFSVCVIEFRHFECSIQIMFLMNYIQVKAKKYIQNYFKIRCYRNISPSLFENTDLKTSMSHPALTCFVQSNALQGETVPPPDLLLSNSCLICELKAKKRDGHNLLSLF